MNTKLILKMLTVFILLAPASAFAAYINWEDDFESYDLGVDIQAQENTYINIYPYGFENEEAAVYNGSQRLELDSAFPRRGIVYTSGYLCK